ncbi:MAG: hypothetical protein IT372_38415 [Polyangiaceae bacterium]|nr:hypothetical protein [Polyangiaceae bacterium]
MHRRCRPLACAAAALAAALVPAAAGAVETMYALSTYGVGGALLTLDKATGVTLSSVTITGQEALFGGLAIEASGMIYSIDGYTDASPDRLFLIDPATGQGTVVGPTGQNWNFRAVHVHPLTDALYGANDNNLFTIDKATGQVTQIAAVTGSTLDQLTTFAFDASGQIYGTDIGGVGLFQIDAVTGQATHLADLFPGVGGTWFKDLAFDSLGALYGVREQGGVYTIDVAAGSVTPIYGGTYWGVAFGGLGGGAGLGSPCGTGGECASGHCVDGVCCDSACGDGDPTDCQACSKEAGAAEDGTCAPFAAGTTCRAAAGACDSAETCDGVSGACPADELSPPATLCRIAAGDCDVAEACTGSSADCPDDAIAAAGSPCRPAAGECDATEVCDGASASCPADAALPDGTICVGGACAAGACEPGGEGGAGGTGGGDTGGADPGEPPPDGDGGCGCRLAGGDPAAGAQAGIALIGLAAAWIGRRRRRAARARAS